MAKTSNLTAFFLAMASSVFLLISGTTGVTTILRIEEFVLRYADFPWISYIFVLLFIVASLGGIAVFVGGVFVLRQRPVLGYIFISLGSGAGVISFALNLIIAGVSGLGYSFLSFSTLGILLAFLAEVSMGGWNKRFRRLWRWLRKVF